MTLKSTVVFALFFCLLPVFGQTDIGKLNNLRLLNVRQNIYVLEGKGGNIGLSVGNDGVFMIDSQFAEGIEDVRDEIKKINKKPIQFLVNTHFHGDHVGGNAFFAREGTVILSQENVRTRLETMIDTASTKMDTKILPTITFPEDITFHFNGEKIVVFHLPNAHTDGDAVVHFLDSNVLHTGDAFINSGYPFIDTKNGGSLQGYIAGLQKISSIINDGTKIIPGHGPVASLKEVTATINMLTFLYKRVTYFHGKQKTENEVAAMKDLTSKYDAEGFGKGFISAEKLLRTLYQEVERENAASRKQHEESRKKVEQMRKEYEKKQE